MKTKALWSLLILFVVCQAGLSQPASPRSRNHRHFKPRYVLVDLESLGVVPPSVAYKVNGSGQITGWKFGYDDSTHTFLFDGTTVSYAVLSANSRGLDINEPGQVVGDLIDFHAGFLYAQGQTVHLNFSPWGINNAGVMAGQAKSADINLAVVSSNGVVTVLGQGWAAAINDAGQIVGSDGYKAVLFTATNTVLLGTLPGGLYSAAWRINQQGHIIGWSYELGLGYRGIIYRDGVMSDLGVLPGHASSFAYDINGADEVVGISFADGYHPTAVLWAQGTIYDLNDFVRAESGYTLEYAYGINDAGQIVGSALYNGQRRAFLLKPLHRPRH